MVFSNFQFKVKIGLKGTVDVVGLEFFQTIEGNNFK